MEQKLSGKEADTASASTSYSGNAANASAAQCNANNNYNDNNQCHPSNNNDNTQVNVKAYKNEMQIIQSYFTCPHFPSTPHKVIDKDHTLLEVFKKSASFYKILSYLQSCGEAVEKTKCSEWIDAHNTSLIPTVSYFIRTLFPRLHKLVDDIPLEDMAQQRFGNRAKRTFHVQFEAHVHEWMIELARTFPAKPSHDNENVELKEKETQNKELMKDEKEDDLRQQHEAKQEESKPYRCNNEYFYTFTNHNEDNNNKICSNIGSGCKDKDCKCIPRSDAEIEQLATEMAAYLSDSFGNATRLDYGSGHELHFFILLMICLEEHGDYGGSLHEVPTILVPPPILPSSSSTSTVFTGKVHLPAQNRSTIVTQKQDSNVNVNSPYIPHPVPTSARDNTRRLRQQFIFGVFAHYMTFVRRLQTHYSLEPAGSHGVWGLDDYHHIPYIFGAAQLIDAEMSRCAPRAKINVTTTTTTITTSVNKAKTNNNVTANDVECKEDIDINDTKENEEQERYIENVIIRPADVCDNILVSRYANEYMYFAMIKWIYDHKSGPFHEHSNMLYNISGVIHWSKVFGGMIKMYAAEVLAKFNVTQHLLFGKHLPWNTKQLNCHTGM